MKSLNSHEVIQVSGGVLPLPLALLNVAYFGFLGAGLGAVSGLAGGYIDENYIHPSKGSYININGFYTLASGGFGAILGGTAGIAAGIMVSLASSMR